MSRRRVVVTGVGLVTPLSALGARETWRALLECRTGVRVLREDEMPKEHRRELAQLPCRIAATVDDEEFTRSRWSPPWWTDWLSRSNAGASGGGGGDESSKGSESNLPRFASRASAFVAAAAAEALEDAGIDFSSNPFYSPSRVAVSVGVGMPAVRAAALAGAELDDDGLLSPSTARSLRDSALASGPASLLAESLGIQGPIFAPSTACAAGASAVADAFEAVASGTADVALAGGAEACVDAVTLAAFSRMRALCTDSNDDAAKATRASRPFGVGRCGFVVGEGAGVLVLEAAETAAQRRRNNARSYCELRGAGVSADAHHAAQPRESGDGAAAAMRQALSVSGIDPSQVSHVSAHATSTPAGDAAEAAALASVLSYYEDGGTATRHGRRRKNPAIVSGVKAAIGHLLGAAGAVEAALAVAALADGRAPPTATLLLSTTTREKEMEKRDGGGGVVATGEDVLSSVGVEENGFRIARAEKGGVALRPPLSHERGLVALSNSFGFGGANVCLAFSSPPGVEGVSARKWREREEEEEKG